MNRRTLLAASFGFGVPLLAPAVGAASSQPPEVTLTAVAEVDTPLGLTWRADDPALYIVGQNGRITRVDGDASTVVLDIRDLTSARGERGLLGLAFTPDGASAYINFTDDAGDTNVVELAVGDDGTFDRDTMRLILFVDQPRGNHNGGHLAFGPNDGLLYIALGDGGGSGDPDRRSQDLGDLLGKVLRIDPTTPSGELAYTIPPDNPFVDVEGARGEIWALGLRNPWKFSFDPDTGDLWIADVGQRSIEEISYSPASGGVDAGRGANYGWSGFEAMSPYNTDQLGDDPNIEGHHGPVFWYEHRGGRCSISGGVRARGETAGPLDGRYVFADLCTGEVMALDVTGAGTGLTVADQEITLAETRRVSAVASGPDGAVYVLSLPGTVYRLDQV